MITAVLVTKVKVSPVSEEQIKKIIAVINQVKKVKQNLQVSIVIVNDEEIRKLNKKYRKINKVTDVLSFAYDEENADIFICYSEAKQPSKFKKLLVHGILHVLGYDHETEADLAKMQAQEQKILSYV